MYSSSVDALDLRGEGPRSVSVIDARIRKKNRQAAWKTLEVVIWATSEICQQVVVVERDNDQNKR